MFVCETCFNLTGSIPLLWLFSTFTLEENVYCMRTQKTLQVFYKPQTDFWMIMVSWTIFIDCHTPASPLVSSDKVFCSIFDRLQIVGVPSEKKTRDNTEYTEYKGEDAHDIVYQDTLKQSYNMFRLFNGTFRDNLRGDTQDQQIEFLNTKLNKFFTKVRVCRHRKPLPMPPNFVQNQWLVFKSCISSI